MSPSGNGFKNTSHKKYQSKEKRLSNLSLMKLIKIGSKYVWLWVAIIEPIDKQILLVDLSFERTTVVAERFIASLINTYDKHPVSTGGGKWYLPQACKFLKLKEHNLHSLFEKSIIERTMQYIKDRIEEGFDDYFYTKRTGINYSM